MPSPFWIYAYCMDGYYGVMEMNYPIGKLLHFTNFLGKKITSINSVYSLFTVQLMVGNAHYFEVFISIDGVEIDTIYKSCGWIFYCHFKIVYAVFCVFK